MKLTFNDVVKHFGGIPALSESLKISPHAVYQWKTIPDLRCHEIANLSGGKYKHSDLRDIVIKETEVA